VATCDNKGERVSGASRQALASHARQTENPRKEQKNPPDSRPAADGAEGSMTRTLIAQIDMSGNIERFTAGDGSHWLQRLKMHVLGGLTMRENW